MRPVNVLFSSVGRRVELIRAFRQAYGELGLCGNVIGLDNNPLAAALAHVDRPYVMPRVSSPDFLPTLARICRLEQVDLIFPLIDLEIPVLAQNQKVLAATGARVVVVDPAAAAIARDKWETYQFLRRQQITAPLSWLPGQQPPPSVRYPLFIKPRQSHSGLNAFPLDNARELEFFASYVPDPLIQEYLPGEEITSDVMCDWDGQVLAIVCRQRLRVRAGEVEQGVTIHSPAIIEACVQIARHLPAVGPLTVQCMMKDGVPHFTEINARLGGGIPLSFAAGAPLPRWLLSRAAGLPVDPPPLGQYQVGLYVSRFDDACFFTQQEGPTSSSPRAGSGYVAAAC